MNQPSQKPSLLDLKSISPPDDTDNNQNSVSLHLSIDEFIHRMLLLILLLNRLISQSWFKIFQGEVNQPWKHASAYHHFSFWLKKLFKGQLVTIFRCQFMTQNAARTLKCYQRKIEWVVRWLLEISHILWESQILRCDMLGCQKLPKYNQIYRSLSQSGSHSFNIAVAERAL